MTRKYGVSSTGLIAPIIREGDDLSKIVTDTVLNAIDNIEDGDIIGITESIVARAEGNYVTIDEVAENIKKELFDPKHIMLIEPIYSRNRFAMILKAFARAAKEKITIVMPPVDEVGNVLKEHPFTNLNYDEYYKSIVEAEGKKCKIYSTMSDYYRHKTADIPDQVVDCRFRLTDNERDFCPHTLRDFCSDKCEFGLEGSNKASEEKLKLFPSYDFAQDVVDEVAIQIQEKTGKKVEVMIYGDGCFKDPVGGIWEFADPITCPAYTEGLEGTPNELKLKNLADEKFANLNGEELSKAIKEDIKAKSKQLKGKMVSQGTTPRRYVDLLASLMDLTSGSGDKGTPIVYVKRYFQNYGND